MKCPGLDKCFWKSEDIFEVPCPACGKSVEFFKDDVHRKCQNCGYKFKNPRLDLGCAKWCSYGKYCLGGEGTYDMMPGK